MTQSLNIERNGGLRLACNIRRPLILSLCLPVGPSAILWGVVSEWIDAIKRQPLRAITHVFEEVFKAVEPLIAYANSLGSVPFELSAALGASLLGPAPCSVFPITVGRHAVGRHSLAAQSSLEAPARFGFALSKCLVGQDAFGATGASTVPFGPRLTLGGNKDYNPLPERSSCEVDDIALPNCLDRHIGPILARCRRTIYDYLAGMTLDASIDRHRAEWRTALGLD